MPIHIDRSRWPLLVFTYDGKPTPDENRDFIKQLDTLLAGNKKYASITDLSRAEMGTGIDQNITRDWMRKNEDRIKDLCVGTAMVVKNPAMRSLLKTIFFIKKPPFPMQLVATVEEAEAFVKERMREHALV